jgi:tripartite-type tricarboxylate transporter receptor subunit TctC
MTIAIGATTIARQCMIGHRILFVAAACLGWIAVAQAQTYPNRPVKIIVRRLPAAPST